MPGPLTRFIRFCMTARYVGKTKTSIIPLSSVKSVTVFLDTSDPDAAALSTDIMKFFTSHKIKANILLNRRRNHTLFGRLRRKFRKNRKEDLFISLMPAPGCFASNYEMTRSAARFKVGRYQIRGNVVDLVVNNSEGASNSQADVFRTIADLLIKIK